MGIRGQWALLEHSPAFCKKWGPLEKRAEGVYLFWAALQTPILHPLYSADHSYTYWLSVVKKMKTHTLFKQRSNALKLWWLYSWKFNPAKARFTLNTQGPVRKMAYIILKFMYQNFYLMKHTRLSPFSLTLSLHSAIETITLYFPRREW